MYPPTAGETHLCVSPAMKFPSKSRGRRGHGRTLQNMISPKPLQPACGRRDTPRSNGLRTPRFLATATGYTQHPSGLLPASYHCFPCGTSIMRNEKDVVSRITQASTSIPAIYENGISLLNDPCFLDHFWRGNVVTRSRCSPNRNLGSAEVLERSVGMRVTGFSRRRGGGKSG